MAVERFFNQSITIESNLGIPDSQGRPTFGDVVKVRVRIQPTNKAIRDDKGVHRTANAKLFLPTSALVLIGDRITLPDGSQPEILSISSIYGSRDKAIYKAVLL